MTYRSVTEMECGRGPDGGSFCHWTITFAATTYSWRYSDVGESGSYTCVGNTVTGVRLSGPNTVTGQYDPATQTLTWNNVAYVPQ
jgi:hypothetical protein